MEPLERFESFFELNYATVVRTLWVYCGDLSVAEEAAQEAFTRAAQDWRKVAGMSSPRGWLHRVAINEVNGHYRRLRARRRAVVRHGVADQADPPDFSSALAVREAVQQLTPRRRMAIALHYFADLSVAEIAEAIDAPTGTVKSLLSRGRESLRTQLEEERPPIEEDSHADRPA